MPTAKEVQRELNRREWEKRIAECESSNMTVSSHLKVYSMKQKPNQITLLLSQLPILLSKSKEKQDSIEEEKK